MYEYLDEAELLELAREGDQDAFNQLIQSDEVKGLIRWFTDRYVRRGLYDAESIVYEVIAAKLHGRDAVVNDEGRTIMRALEPFEAGKPIKSYFKEINGILKDSLTGVTMGSGIAPRQYAKYSAVRRDAGDSLDDLEPILYKHRLSRADFDAILAVATQAKPSLADSAPSLADMESAELDIILEMVRKVLDEDEKTIIHLKHYYNQDRDISDAMVAEVLTDEGAHTSTSTVQRKRTAAMTKVRSSLGLAA